MARASFCTSCGARLPSTPPVTCPSCGASHWRNPKPGAAAIVVDAGNVLLVRRAYAPWSGAWCAPGGFCEAGEHPIETVEREALEETGLPVRVTGYVGVWVDEYADEPGNEDAEVINVAYYLALPDGGGEGPLDAAEVSEVRWFPWDGLPEKLAPPRTLEAVVAAARTMYRNGTSATPLPDKPRLTS